MFKAACHEAYQLYPSTLWNVLQKIANFAIRFPGCNFASIRVPDDDLSPSYWVWAGVTPEEWSRLPNRARVRMDVEAAPKLASFFESEAKTSTPIQAGLYAGFDGEIGEGQKQEFNFLLTQAANAVHHAKLLCQRSIHLARQFGNLHDIARILAQDPDVATLQWLIAGHALNILSADLVVIHDLRSGSNAVAGQHSDAVERFKVPVEGILADLLRQEDSVQFFDADSLCAVISANQDIQEIVRSERIQTAAFALLQGAKEPELASRE